jgi:hypothetical protein
MQLRGVYIRIQRIQIRVCMHVKATALVLDNRELLSHFIKA